MRVVAPVRPAELDVHPFAGGLTGRELVAQQMVVPVHLVAVFLQTPADKVGGAVPHPRQPRDDAVEVGGHVLVDVLVQAVVVLSDDGGEARNVGRLPHGVCGHDEVDVDVVPLADLRESPLSEGLSRQELPGIVQKHVGVQPGLHGGDVNAEPRHVLAKLQRVTPSVGGVEYLSPGSEPSSLDLFGVGRNVDGVDVRVKREECH